MKTSLQISLLFVIMEISIENLPVRVHQCELTSCGLCNNVKVPSKENDSSDSTEVNVKNTCAKSGLPEPVVRFFQVFNPINWVKNIHDFLKYTIQFFEKPGWKTLSEIMGTDHIEKRPERLCPSDWDCKSHNLGLVQDTMGASCLVFFLPGCVGAYMALTGKMSHCALGGAVLSMFLAYVSSVSFLADYWYMGDKPDQEVPDCQKQVIFNKIDRVNVPIIGFVCSSIGLIQFLWARGMNWAYPLLFVVFISAAAVQYFSLDRFNHFARITYAPGYDHEQPCDEAAQALSFGLQMHIIWHILACIPPIVQMYGLMVYGLVLPSWLRCLSC